MSVAVVFDSAGTLLNTYRVAKDICHKKLLPGIETTTLTFSSPDRVLIVLPVHSKDLMASLTGTPPLGIPRPSTISGLVSAVPGRSRLQKRSATSSTRTSGAGWVTCRNVSGMSGAVCREESMLTLNSGAIINMAQGGIEFTITAGGWPFDGQRRQSAPSTGWVCRPTSPPVTGSPSSRRWQTISGSPATGCTGWQHQRSRRRSSPTSSRNTTRS